jgi:undecaprenyl diphosphate synthase
VHVAIIMDGNGRWAAERSKPRLAGHREGATAVNRIVTHCRELGIRCLSLYAFSTENWARPTHEVAGLMHLLEEYIDSEVERLLGEGIRLVVSGRLHELPAPTRNKLAQAIERTSGCTEMVLNLALSYGGRAELVDAVQSLAHEIAAGTLAPTDITEDLIGSRIYNPDLPDIDLLIRTSGEQRVSNFMLWRIAYAEMVFVDTLWPDFSDADLDSALRVFDRRERRYGAVREGTTSQ